MLRPIPKTERLILPEKEWVCTFSDDFAFLDRTKWKFDLPHDPKDPALDGVRRCCFNVDDEDVVFVHDGQLHIRTLWKNGKYGEGWYSAMLDTGRFGSFVSADGFAPEYRGFSQTYGYFEVRCKVPKAVGIWSAFWLMPDNDIAFSEADVQFSGEDGVEIDVMESPHMFMRTRFGKNRNIHCIHADGYDDRLKSVRSPAFYVPRMYDDFHTYGLLWEQDKYSFYIDGYKTWETEHIYKGRRMGVCRVPEYLLLSTEVAGFMENGKQYPGKQKDPNTGKITPYWCGNPDKNDKSRGYDFVVDWVKVYQKRKKFDEK